MSQTSVQLPSLWKARLGIWILGIIKIPMIFFVRPYLRKLSLEETIISIPYTRRNKNHLDSIYFGALCVGADVCGGLLAWTLLKNAERENKGARFSLAFSEVQGKFHKRIDGEAVFICHDGLKILEAVNSAIQSGERVTLPVSMIVKSPLKYGDEVCAEFTLGLSIKLKRKITHG